jgi:hypothetical protein
MNNKYFLLLMISLLLGACQGNNQASSNETNQAEQATTTQGDTEAAKQGEQLYPSLPLDTLVALYNECDFIDYVFYYTNFSVSQSEKKDIQTAIRYISEEVPLINAGCKPQGRLFFQVDGENRLEADLYFAPECTYYIFYKEGKPAFANKLMPGGIQFYNNIFNSIQQ